MPIIAADRDRESAGGAQAGAGQEREAGDDECEDFQERGRTTGSCPARERARCAGADSAQERGDEHQQEQQAKRPDVEPPRVRGRERRAREGAQLLKRLQSHDLGTLMPMMPLVRRAERKEILGRLISPAMSLLGSAPLPRRAAGARYRPTQVPRTRTVSAQGADPERRPRGIASGWARFGSLRCFDSTMPGTTATSSGFLRLSRSPGTLRPSWRAGFGGSFRPARSSMSSGTRSRRTSGTTDLSSRSFFGGNYSAYLLGFFNRASLGVGGFNSKGLQYISSRTHGSRHPDHARRVGQDGRRSRLELFPLRQCGVRSTALRQARIFRARSWTRTASSARRERRGPGFATVSRPP